MKDFEKKSIEDGILRFWDSIPEGLVDDLSNKNLIDFDRLVKNLENHLENE